MLEQFQVNNYNALNYLKLNDNLLYLDFINNNYEFNQVGIAPDTAYRYQGNFIGLLRETGIVEPHLYMYTMYINNIKNPIDFDGKLLVLTVPIKPPIPFD